VGYDFRQIKARGNLVQYLEGVLGYQPVEPWRYNSPLRSDSDGNTFAVKQEADGVWTWYDHVLEQGGSIIDLCARVRHGGDLQAAADELGAWMSLESTVQDPPKAVARRESARVCDANIAKEYLYHNLDGTVQFKVIRYEEEGKKKTFRQWQPLNAELGTWSKNVEGITPNLYRWPQWADKKLLCITEGEKDADSVVDVLGLPATTCPMGSGKWQERFTEAVAGKKLIIFHDNDAPGRAHALQIARACAPVCPVVKVLCLSDQPKGDVTDWIEDVGRTAAKASIAGILKAAPDWTDPGDEWAGGEAEQATGADDDDRTSFDTDELDAQIAEERAEFLPGEGPSQEMIDAAKKANKRSLCNYTVSKLDDGKVLKEPRLIDALAKEIHTRFLQFPRVLGSVLFDHDRDTGDIRFLSTTQELFAWMQSKSKKPILWGRGEGCVSRDELYHHLVANAQSYYAIRGVPSFPTRKDIYYTHGQIPEPSPDHEYLNGFIDFFEPATPADRVLIGVFVASCLYYRPEAKRPMWIIDSQHGQGSGKTTLVEMVARLYGDDLDSQSPITVQARELQNENLSDRITRRILSTGGRRKSILLIDNVTGSFACPALAALITGPPITGLSPYGKSEETRPNDLTYALTANSAMVDRDLASRAFIIHLRKAPPSDSWAIRLHRFVEDYRQEIISDILDVLGGEPSYRPTIGSRFEGWEADVFLPMVPDAETYEEIHRVQGERRSSADIEQDVAEALSAKIREEMHAINGYDPTLAYWLTSEVVMLWARDAVEEWKHRSHSIMQNVRNLAKVGLMPELDGLWTRYPHNPGSGTRRSGIMWGMQNRDGGVMTVTLASDKKTVELKTNY
jgi:hypothetical protein